MRITPSGIATEKINPADFPEDYQPGPRNCFDCKHFKCKIPLSPTKNGKIKIDYNLAVARCSENMLLVEDSCHKGKLKEPIFELTDYQWVKIKKHGWRHKRWNFANRCSEFESMANDDGTPELYWIDESAEVKKEVFDQLRAHVFMNSKKIVCYQGRGGGKSVWNKLLNEQRRIADGRSTE